MMEKQPHDFGNAAAFNELLNKFEDIQGQLSTFVADGQEQLNRFKKKLARMDQDKAEALDVKQLATQLQQVAGQLGTMESGILQEFRVSQEIMRNMIEHDLSIEKQKIALKLEMEKKKADIEANLLEQQNAMNLQRQQDAAAFRKKLWIQVGTILTPILVALTTIVVKIIEGL